MPFASELVIESPAPGQNVYDEGIFVTGSIAGGGADIVRVCVDGVAIGQTRLLFPTSVSACFGFRILCRISPGVAEPRDVTLRVVAGSDDPGRDNDSISVERTIRVLPAALSHRPFGDVVPSDRESILHRENIYGSGPPIEEAGTEVSRLLRAYLRPGVSVADVGCGAGAYGPPLRDAGHDWLGLETNAYCCEILTRRALPFRNVDPESARLPCADAEFDSAICIEVVEHTKDPVAFVAEIARITQRRALFSVPNIEVLPYLYDWRVVPWHLLEADHKNFFTRASLSALLARHFRNVEVFPYGEHPLRTRDEVPVYVHLFAVADK